MHEFELRLLPRNVVFGAGRLASLSARYRDEAAGLYRVLHAHLGSVAWLAGEEYSVVDIAVPNPAPIAAP
jgi:glutathione S-transferase